MAASARNFIIDVCEGPEYALAYFLAASGSITWLAGRVNPLKTCRLLKGPHTETNLQLKTARF